MESKSQETLEQLMLETTTINKLQTMFKEMQNFLNTMVTKSKKEEPVQLEAIQFIIDMQIDILNLLFKYFSTKLEITKMKIAGNKKDYEIETQ